MEKNYKWESSPLVGTRMVIEQSFFASVTKELFSYSKVLKFRLLIK